MTSLREGMLGGTQSSSHGDCEATDETRRSKRSNRDSKSSMDMAVLGQTLERELIPRLMMALKSVPPAAVDSTTAEAAANAVVEPLPSEQEVGEFIRLLIAHETSVAHAYIEALRSRGVGLKAIYLHLMAPAARRLGQMWEEDLCDFTQVTIGVCRMHQLVHEFSPRFCQDPLDLPHEGRRALLVPAPGEQHTFGLLLVMEFFRRAGWHVVGGLTETNSDLEGIVQRQRFQIVGLSLSAERHVDDLTRQIRRIRRKSRNRNIGVLVGGKVFVEHPEWAAKVGADAVALDEQEAIRQADQIVTAVE